MTPYEMGHDIGFTSEKIAEIIVTKNVMPVTKSSLNLARGFGKASKYTNMASYGLKGRLGRLPFTIPTPIIGVFSRSNDIGIIMSRNLITPFGYLTGIGQLQHLKKH